MRDQPAKLIAQAEFHEHIGQANIQPSLAVALRRAQEIPMALDPHPTTRAA
jgi:hypothetical protein